METKLTRELKLALLQMLQQLVIAEGGYELWAVSVYNGISVILYNKPYYNLNSDHLTDNVITYTQKKVVRDIMHHLITTGCCVYSRGGTCTVTKKIQKYWGWDG